MSDEQKKFDGMLMTILQHDKQINPFFNRIFGFLRRNTDFFANQKMAEEAITSTCKNNFEIFQKDKLEKQEEQAKKKKRDEERKQKEKQKNDTLNTPSNPELKPEEPKIVESPTISQPSSATEEGDKGKDEPAPKGNGGNTGKYIWTQTLQELHMYIPIRSQLNKKSLVVKIKNDTLLVKEADQPALIDGQFWNKINVDDSLWTIESGDIDDYNGRYIHIAIEKWKNQDSWWPTVIKGDPQINTQKINPEPSKLEDLQGQTKATVQKMMFDMRQKQMGKPTSDELQKQQKLQQFMKAHPEMDFSKCKFN